MTPEVFRQVLLEKSPEEIVRDILLSGDPVGISNELVSHVQREITASFNIPINSVDLYVVGSGKMGFSIVEKWDLNTKVKLQRFRAFSPLSDIDIAVVSQRLFYLFWKEISTYSHGNEEYRKDTKQGMFMLWGWLRPDHFPKNAVLPFCQTWWDKFNGFSADTRFGRRKVRGGLYFSRWFLEAYQCRAVRECRTMEELMK